MCIWCAVTKCNDDNDLTERQIKVLIKHMRKDYAGTEAKLNGPYGRAIFKAMMIKEGK